MASSLGVQCLFLASLLCLIITIKSLFPHPDILSSFQTSEVGFQSNGHLSELPSSGSIDNYGQHTDLRRRRLSAVKASASLKTKRELSDSSQKTEESRSVSKSHEFLPNDFSLTSPANGTDIITHPISVIKCANQTMCIHPRLQLQEKYDVYFCKHLGHGVRFYFLVMEGLLLHPNIRMIEDIEKAQVIVYLPESSPWQKSECNNPKYKSKTIVLDESDGPDLFEPTDPSATEPNHWLMYFKRSFVRRHNGAFKNPRILPMTYTIVEAYVKTGFNMMRDRNLEIVCTLRGSHSDPVRLRVRQWVEEYAKARGVKNYVAGQVNSASRTEVSTDYLTQMFRARLIVTSNPSDWEGDFRLMEAMASGALILVDRMSVPRPYALIEGTHIVYYDNNNKTDVFEKLDFYRKNLEVARRVAVSGYLHAMKHHRAANLIDYVFRTLHLKTAMAKNQGGAASLPQYTETGYDMRNLALATALKLRDGTKAER